MKVVIVAKTRKGAGACIGAITFDGQSVRLIAADAERNEQAGKEYEIGQVWEVHGAPATSTIPPHVENWVVQCKTQLPLSVDPTSFINLYMPANIGDFNQLYEGLLQATTTGALYITQKSSMPAYSTTFWRPDQPLVIDDTNGKNIRYRYPTPDGGRTVVFVGFQNPLEVIPAGTLLRISLAHWWRPAEKTEQELRCYVQLSGWFLPATERPIIEDDEGTSTTTIADDGELPPAPAPQILQSLLKKTFGYDTFRPLQVDVINSVLDGHDTLVIMPTGGGKSLCYQLPALTFPGLTVVVSPLISLMQDQVEQLRQADVTAIYLNGMLTYGNYLAGMQAVRAGKVKLLYLSPETLLRAEILLMLEKSKVNCLVIDEAHCISQWGPEFRENYYLLNTVRQRLPQAVCIALTATATSRVQEDIKARLGFHQSNTFIAGFDRPNLLINVKPKNDALQQMLTFLAAHPEQSGIIYCNTQHRVDELHAALVAVGIKALPYHGGMESVARERNQRAFMHDDVRVMVATVAFGMGINKPDVRFVLHVDLPQDMESYYQQIGRAGRDGLPAECLLLFGYGDVHTIHHFINQGATAEAEGRRERLQTMVSWAESFACRRRGLLAYFGEAYPSNNCGLCDNCLYQEEKQVDITLPAQKFLSCVVRTNELFGVGHIIKVLRGSRAKEVLKWSHDKVTTYGIGQEYSVETWKHLAQQFLRLGLLKQTTGTGSLKMTEKGWAVCNGERVWGTLAEAEEAAASNEPMSYNAELFARLRILRKELADAEGVPPYIIFADRSLQEMAAYYPQSTVAFSQLHGVGQMKLEKYAAHFLALIGDYCTEHQLAEKPRPRAVVIAPPAVKPRSLEVGDRFRAGESVAQLQESYNVHRETILHHLATFVQAGQRLPVARLQAESTLAVEQQRLVFDHFAEFGAERLRPIFEAMAEQVSYDELHLLRALYRLRE